MEPNLTAVSPLPIADDDAGCTLDVPEAATDGATLLVCLCGLLGNGAVLWLLGCRIRRNPVTVYVLNLAVADFAFLLFMLASALLFLLDNLSCSTLPIHTYAQLLLLLSLFTHNTGMYLLTAISAERCVSIFCSSSNRCRRPQHLSAALCAVLWALSIAVIAAVTSLCLSHRPEQCRLALLSMYVLNFLVFAPSMVVSNAILLAKVLCGSRQRQPRRLYAVIFLTVLCFLLFGVPLSVCNFLQHFRFVQGQHQVVFLLACINSGINPFIYVLVGSSWRLQVAFQRVFGELGDTRAGSDDTTVGTLSPAR